ncbi:MAG: hypothetical protein MUE67_11420 [Anaerolineales bacterium]|jgi:hypothetical protein|nr:hypothetical protein [Anaerolineales bacterium]
MSEQPVFLALAPIFQAVAQAMSDHRLEFNAADTVNGNHGDHMLEIFHLAVEAAEAKQGDGLAVAMEYAGILLRSRPENGSAQVYANGLAQLGEQFQQHQIGLEDLAPYLRKVLKEEKDVQTEEKSSKSGEVLKALLTALAGWQQVEDGQEKSANPLDLGYMFDLGVAYLQAKQRGGTRAETLADAAASVSPLKKTPHRYQSGKIAILALLQALAAQGV